MPKEKLPIWIANLIALALLTLSSCVLGAAAQAPDSLAASLVQQFYPQVLVDQARSHPSVPLSQQSAFAVYNEWHDGTPKTIIAAYSNGADGAVLVLARQQNGAGTVTYELDDFGGGNPSVQLADVDGDGVNEVVISYVSFTGLEGDRIFRLTSSSLQEITPSGFALLNPSLVDISHDGTLQILSVDDPHPPSSPSQYAGTTYSLFHIVSGQYKLDRPFLAYFSFTRKTAAPQTEARQFLLPNGSTGPYMLRLVNGDKNGNNRASSGHIVVDGVEVIGPDQFNQHAEFLSETVNLQPQNTIQVTLEGKPGSKIIVTVEDSAAVAKAQQ